MDGDETDGEWSERDKTRRMGGKPEWDDRDQGVQERQRGTRETQQSNGRLGIDSDRLMPSEAN